MSKAIDVNVLSENSLKKAINELEQYKNSIITKTQLFAQRLADEGVTYAKINVTNMGAIDTGELLESIKVEGGNIPNGSLFFVVATSEHAVYVEFGTGYIGREIPYIGDEKRFGWSYVSGDKVVSNANNGVYGWFFFYDGHLCFTAGMESRPFMWDASRELRRNVEKIAKEVFANG